MFTGNPIFVAPTQLDLAEIDSLDQLLPPFVSYVTPKNRGISVAVALGMAARALFLPAPTAMSFDDYMAEAYHQVICGNGPRRAVDPAVFAQVRDVLVPIAQEKQNKDAQSGKLFDPQAPPPVPEQAPCCSGDAAFLVLRRRHSSLVPA